MAALALPDWTDEAISLLAGAEAEVEDLSAQIRQILTDLTKNATNRVKTLFEISQYRIAREELIEHLYAVQEHNRELLADANQQVDIQQEIATELAQLNHQAALDVVADGEDDDGAEFEMGRAMDRLTLAGLAEHIGEAEEVKLYRQESARLNTAYRASELALQSTLAALRHSQANAPTYLPELVRLQGATQDASDYLQILTSERARRTRELVEREERREALEQRQRGWVLELIIGWDERRREGGEVGERSGKGEVRRGGGRGEAGEGVTGRGR